MHDDLIKTRNRTKKVIDITEPARPKNYFMQPHPSAWHGTMTIVVCAGDGYCSNGLYKGIAPDAELVLLKVQDDKNKITTANITKALQWVLQHHQTYNIKIINISLVGDEAESYCCSAIDQLAEKLIDAGLTIVAAVGNDEHAAIKPPANEKNVIAVGGIDDNNFLDAELQAYHSSFGTTVDGLYKPELVANAIWIAAPILPGTKDKDEAELLHKAIAMANESLIVAWPEINKILQLNNDNEKINEVAVLRKLLADHTRQTKFFSANYMHVDGTSFAAPIVCAVIAQLLQANAAVDPACIRRVFFARQSAFPTLLWKDRVMVISVRGMHYYKL